MSIANRKEREKERRRNDILQAAEKLFFARGYDNVTMDDIAKEVELNKATLYLYFKDKESLFFTVVLCGVIVLSSMVKDREKAAPTGFEKVWGIGEAYFSFVDKYPDYNRAYNYFYSGRFDLEGQINPDTLARSMLGGLGSGTLFWKSVDMAANRAGGEVALQVIGLNHEIFILLYNAIKKGMEEGAFRRDLDPEKAAIVFMLLLESVPRMRPDLAHVLEKRGTDQQKFARDIRGFMGHMLMDKK